MAALLTISDVVGWTYFVLWSASFYPQVYENWRNKSVKGFSFDYLVLNLLGFFCYSIFNVSMFTNAELQHEYLEKYGTDEGSVRLNDVFFAVHALTFVIIQGIQCLIYDRGGQKISKTAWFILGLLLLSIVVQLVMALTGWALTWLWFVTWLGYVKTVVTCIKYVPQVVLNWRNKSTRGFNVWGVILDLLGGMLSFCQMIMLAIYFKDSSQIFGNGPKLGISLLSLVYPTVLTSQHYCCYHGNDWHEFVDDVNVDDSVQTDGKGSVPSGRTGLLA